MEVDMTVLCQFNFHTVRKIANGQAPCPAARRSCTSCPVRLALDIGRGVHRVDPAVDGVAERIGFAFQAFLVARDYKVRYCLPLRVAITLAMVYPIQGPSRFSRLKLPFSTV